MAKSYKVNVPLDIELYPVQYMKVSENCADVWLRKNITTEIISAHSEEMSEQETQTAEELYFQVDASAISKEDIENDFDKYWICGEKWIDERNMTDVEKIARLENENAKLNKCILELCEMM